nr:AMP-binding protein [Halorhodospira abdelmalekii]
MARHGEREAICALTRDGVVRCSYSELADRARALGAGLAARGIERGEPVGLLAPNSAEWIVACLGIIEAGAVVTPYDTQMPSAELTHAIADSEVRYIFTAGEAARRFAELELEQPPQLIHLDAAADAADGWQAWCRDTAPEPPRVGPDEMVTLFYTSGTTGAPKGVPLNHGNIASNVAALLEQELAYPDDRVFVPLPYHHVYPFSIGLFTPLALGATVVLPYSVLGPQIVRALREGEATIMLGVPRLYEALDSAIRTRVAERGARAERIFAAMMALSQAARARYGWRIGKHLFRGLQRRMAPQVRMVVSGGAPLDPQLGERLRGLGWEVATGYGLTETSPILTYNPPDRVKLESAGLPLSGLKLRIGEVASPRGETGESGEAEEGAEEEAMPQHGEVQVRGPNVFSGYHALPEKTAAAFTADGYFRTGDLGWFDEAGYLHLAGRASEMIVLAGGENIDPERVERALSGTRAIRDAGVLEHKGRLVALLFADPDALRGLSPESARQQVNAALQEAQAALPSHHQLSDYRISPDPLPRTRLGKMRRHKLREQYEQVLADEAAGAGQEAAATPVAIERMAVEDQQLLQIAAARRVWDALTRRFAKVRLTPDTDLHLDLGIDSLGWIDLTLELREHSGVALDEAAIGRVATVRDLLREAAESGEAEAADGAAGGGGALPLIEQLRDPDTLLTEQQRRWLAPRGLSERAGGHVARAFAKVFFRWYAPLEVEQIGEVPIFEPVVLVPNHRSVLDSPVIGSVLPYERLLRLYWGGFTGLLFGNRLVRFFSRSTQILPVDPHAGPRTSLALGAAALQRGYALVWFPEGRRAPTTELLPFQPGVGLLLEAHPVPAVPVWIEGTEQAMPIGRRWPRPRPVRIRFGVPAMPEVLAEEGEGETRAQCIADALRRRLLDLGEESGGGQSGEGAEERPAGRDKGE